MFLFVQFCNLIRVGRVQPLLRTLTDVTRGSCNKFFCTLMLKEEAPTSFIVGDRSGLVM